MMLALLLLVGLTTLASQEDVPAEVSPADEYQSLRQTAGDDLDKLWEVVEFCETNGLEEERTAVLEAIIANDVLDFRAHELLGYQLQDLEWIHPDEIENVSKNLFKCGDEWLPIDAADEYHANLETWWRIPSNLGHFRVYATTKRWVADEALLWAEVVFNDLVRLYGRAPEDPAVIVVLRDRLQYNEFTMGDPGKGILGTESTGYSSLYGAYQAETWFDQVHAEFPRAGVAYWDISTNASHAWGKMHFRHAAGLAFAEALDPSVDFERAFIRSLGGAGQLDPAGFWREKKIPMWIRFGGAVYAERFFYDGSAERDGGDPRQLKTWTITTTIQTLRPLAEIFRFSLNTNKIEDSQKLMAEAGLLVAFILDGNCKPVERAHQAFKVAFRSKKDLPEAVQGLQEAIVKHEPELFAFADLKPRAAAAAPAEAAAKGDADVEAKGDAEAKGDVEAKGDTDAEAENKEQPDETDEPKEKDGSGAASGSSQHAASGGR